MGGRAVILARRARLLLSRTAPGHCSAGAQLLRYGGRKGATYTGGAVAQATAASFASAAAHRRPHHTRGAGRRVESATRCCRSGRRRGRGDGCDGHRGVPQCAERNRAARRPATSTSSMRRKIRSRTQMMRTTKRYARPTPSFPPTHCTRATFVN